MGGEAIYETGSEKRRAIPKPRLPRREIGNFIRLCQGDRVWFVELRDISLCGAQLETLAPLITAGRVSIFPHGLDEIHGTVRWIRGLRVGIEFNESVKLEQLESWITNQRAEDDALQKNMSEMTARAAPADERSAEAHGHGK